MEEDPLWFSHSEKGNPAQSLIKVKRKIEIGLKSRSYKKSFRGSERWILNLQRDPLNSQHLEVTGEKSMLHRIKHETRLRVHSTNPSK